MKRKIWALGFFSVLSLGFFAHLPAASSETQPTSITIGIIPGEDPERLRKNGIELARQIQKKIGVQTNIFVSKNYQGLIDAMKNKKIDFAFFTAMSFVFAEKEADAKVLLKKVWKNPYYYSTIISLKSSHIERVQDLKDKTFAYVDEKSTSGYLYPRVYFQQQKIDPTTFFKKVIFAGNHEAAIQSVIDKKADAAAVFADGPTPNENAWARFAPKTLDQMNLVWISKPIPNDPFCVRKDFYDKYTHLTHDVMYAFIELKDGPKENNALEKLFGITEMKLATSAQYEPVRELVRELKLGLN